jgi:glycosyltransferase involved in cell wall biosynthesis
LKVLIVHNYLRPPSGENTVFGAEKELLAVYGTEIASYEKNNDEIESFGRGEKLKLSLKVTWSKESYREIKQLIREEKPDVAHFHNTFPLISPSAYYACQAEGLPVVQTLHNHRLVCPGGYLLRDGAICSKCIVNGLLWSVKKG